MGSEVAWIKRKGSSGAMVLWLMKVYDILRKEASKR